MRTAWRSPSADHHAPPVEMRFVDMFMAALGALIFMAMLMAFLLRFYPRQEAPSTVAKNGNNFRVQPFKLITRTLPSARAGERYEIAFAFQGGLPPTSWEVAAGQGEIPAGLKFDVMAGTLSGVPQKAGIARFVVKAKDQFGTMDSRPYDFTVVQPNTGSRKIENGLAIAMFLAALLLWLGTAAATLSARRVLNHLKSAQEEGQTAVRIETGPGTHEIVEFDEGGLVTYEAKLEANRKVSWFFLFVLLVLGGWLVWRIWFS
jgi:hypothetical protein